MVRLYWCVKSDRMLLGEERGLDWGRSTMKAVGLTFEMGWYWMVFWSRFGLVRQVEKRNALWSEISGSKERIL